MSATWTQYSVECSDGVMSDRVFDSLWLARRELERIEEAIAADRGAKDLTAWIVEREVEAGEWERS